MENAPPLRICRSTYCHREATFWAIAEGKSRQAYCREHAATLMATVLERGWGKVSIAAIAVEDPEQ